MTLVGQACLFCGGDASEPDHARRCDGRQGGLEAAPRRRRRRPPPTRPDIPFDVTTTPPFDGPAYTVRLDHERLADQLQRIFALMRDGKWRTLGEIALATGDPQASISAQLRHLRKRRFGSHVINKRRRGAGRCGLYEYQLIVNLQQRAAS